MKHYTITYLLFLSSIMSYAQFGSQQIISTEFSGLRSVYSVDIDGDGDMDVLSASEGDNKIAWHENATGLGNFGSQQIITQNLHAPVDVFAIDLDGDTDLDVLVASKGYSPDDGKVVWYENLDGLGDFSSFKTITNITQGAVSVFAIDLDGDEDKDVLSASFTDNTVAWYENIDGLGNFGSQQIISNSVLSTRNVYSADIDGDGDNDVLAASTASDEILWFENTDGNGNFGPQQIITINANGVNSVYAIDIDGDDDLDVLAAEFGDDEITWFENLDGLGNFGSEQIITNNAFFAGSVFAIDLDNDNDIDVLSASSNDTDISWYENTDGLGTFGPQQNITTLAEGARDVFATDIDNDGDNDVLSVSSTDDKLAWYENLTILDTSDISLKIALYPNPVRTILIIENENYNLHKLEIYDILGRLVLKQSNPTNQIDVSSLESGLLFVKIETSKGDFMKKILKE